MQTTASRKQRRPDIHHVISLLDTPEVLNSPRHSATLLGTPNSHPIYLSLRNLNAAAVIPRSSGTDSALCAEPHMLYFGTNQDPDPSFWVTCPRDFHGSGWWMCRGDRGLRRDILGLRDS